MTLSTSLTKTTKTTTKTTTTKTDTTPELVPTHTTPEHAALRSLIERTQFVRPPVVDIDGNVIDGRASTDIAKELGLPVPPPLVYHAPHGVSPEGLRYALNVPTRASKAALRPALVEAILTSPHKSDRALGELFGVDGKTVAKVRRLLGPTAEIPQLRTGRDGKQHPAKKPAKPAKPLTVQTHRRADVPVVTAVIRELERARESVGGRRTTGALRRRAAKVKRHAMAATASALPPGQTELIHADFRDLGMKDACLDVIFTDVPWQATDLAKPWAEWCHAKLKVGGSLVFYPGHSFLPTWLSAVLAAGFKWRAQLISIYDSRRTVIEHGNNTAIGYNPILWLTKGEYPRGEEIVPTNLTSPAEVDLHPKGWQKPVSDAVTLLATISQPGDRVCDPFSGVATTAVAVAQLGGGRSFVGTEIDETTHRIGLARFKRDTGGGVTPK